MPVAPPRRRQLLAVLALAATLSACASAPAPRSGDADPRQADNAASGEPRRHVAMVLLSEPRLPPGDAVGAAYREMEHLPPAATPSQVEGDKQVMSVVVEPGVVAAIGLMPMPVPDGEADELAKYSVAVVGGLEELAPHRAHLVVLLTDERSATAFESASRLISLLAAIAEATPSVGVYYGEGNVTHPRSTFLSVAREGDPASRAVLWSGISVAPDPADRDRYSFLSLGMGALGLPELLLSAKDTPAPEAVAYFFDLLSYVGARGEPLPEGDTVGRSETEKRPVHYVASPTEPGEKVWRVELD